MCEILIFIDVLFDVCLMLSVCVDVFELLSEVELLLVVIVCVGLCVWMMCCVCVEMLKLSGF